jgi:hypothetical protein
VIDYVANNMWALIITGALGMVLAYLLLAFEEGPLGAFRTKEVDPGTKR